MSDVARGQRLPFILSSFHYLEKPLMHTSYTTNVSKIKGEKEAKLDKKIFKSSKIVTSPIHI